MEQLISLESAARELCIASEQISPNFDIGARVWGAYVGMKKPSVNKGSFLY